MNKIAQVVVIDASLEAHAVSVVPQREINAIPLFNIVKVKPSQGMRLGGMQKVGERDAYVVENATDAKTERYYFDSQTGLLLRKITINKTLLMPFPEQLDFEDYREWMA